MRKRDGSNPSFRPSPLGLVPWVWISSFIVLGFFFPGPLHAQSIFGRVIVAGDTTGVSGAELALSDSTGFPVSRVQSSESGHFRIPAPGAGRFILRVSRIGFADIQVEATLREEETVEVEIRMAEEAIPLEPLVVVGRRELKPGSLEQFYDRMARNKQRGKGHFLTREQIEVRGSLPLGLIIQTVPGVRVVGSGHTPVLPNPGSGGGAFCVPEFFLDGRPMMGGFRELYPLDLEGIEVYRGLSESVDGEVPNLCGQIFIWRRSDWGNPITWKRAFLAVGLGAVLWALVSLI